VEARLLGSQTQICYNQMMLQQYPKLAAMAATFVAAYLLTHYGWLEWVPELFQGHGYLSMFVAGILFSFGFTSAFGLALFIEMSHQVHPLLGAVCGGIGAMLADMLIFEVLRYSIFHDEIHRLRYTRFVTRIHALLHHQRFSDVARRYLLWSFAGIVIASPLPDELGAALVSSTTDIKGRQFALLCLLLNGTGILFILLGARALS
jgi:hypothetical protein